MAYPTPSQNGSTNRCSQSSVLGQSVANQASAGRSGYPPTSGEGEHQLEKLEFALAVALTRGDEQRSQALRDQIAALGGNREEPGT
jgi:hypothetical protein